MTSITEPGFSVAWSWDLVSDEKVGREKAVCSEDRERIPRGPSIARAIPDSGPRMAWLCPSKLRLGRNQALVLWEM